MILGKVVDLFSPRRVVFDPARPMRLDLNITVTVFPNGSGEVHHPNGLTAEHFTLVVSKRQWHLVMHCHDGLKRSFGEGTRVCYRFPESAA